MNISDERAKKLAFKMLDVVGWIYYFSGRFIIEDDSPALRAARNLKAEVDTNSEGIAVLKEEK